MTEFDPVVITRIKEMAKKRPDEMSKAQFILDSLNMFNEGRRRQFLALLPYMFDESYSNNSDQELRRELHGNNDGST